MLVAKLEIDVHRYAALPDATSHICIQTPTSIVYSLLEELFRLVADTSRPHMFSPRSLIQCKHCRVMRYATYE